MNQSAEMKTNHKFAALAALLLAVTVSTTVAAESVGAGPFTMAVILDSSHGRKVTHGLYKQAIRQITERGNRLGDRFEEQVNLCVAYTKTSEIEKAGSACDAAIASAENWAPARSNDRSPKARAYRFDLAIALSNRGVLMAATGETDLAQRDFLAAKELQTDLKPVIENNLKRLRQINRS